jgi:hypothetical protein
MTGDDVLGALWVINIVAGILGVMFDTSKENTFREKVVVFIKYSIIWPYTFLLIIYNLFIKWQKKDIEKS